MNYNSRKKGKFNSFRQNSDLEKIHFLKQKMNPPTIQEQNELMFLLKKNDLINDCQYRHYINNSTNINSNSKHLDIIETMLAVLFALFLTYFVVRFLTKSRFI